MAMGERTPLAVVDAPASGRMAVAEAVTNLLAAPIESSRVKLSANWMAACGEPGEDADLYDAVRAVGLELCPALGISIPVGKDSLSMRTQWTDGRTTPRKVTSPVSLIVSAFADAGRRARHADAAARPREADTVLVLVDLGRGRNRMAGSILAQTLEQTGDAVPDLDDPQDLVRWSRGGQRLRAQGLLLAYHDRSDGGLFATVCEMAFAGQGRRRAERRHAGHRGRRHQRQPRRMGDSKNWASQVQARRDELTLKALFNEELGVVLQVRSADRDAVMQVLREHGLSRHSHCIGKTRPPASADQRGRWRDPGLARRQGKVFARRCRPAPGLGRGQLEDLPRCATTRPAPMRSTRPPAIRPTPACMWR
jgi:phosphoribosylformylglycinamidine synthase